MSYFWQFKIYYLFLEKIIHAMSKPKCKYCNKPMTYNTVLGKYECDDPECWIKRIPKQAAKIMGFDSSIPSMVNTPRIQTAPETIIRLGATAIKTTYNVIRSIGKAFKE